MRPLDNRIRIRLLYASVYMCLGSLLLAPLVGRSSVELSAREAIFDRTLEAGAVETNLPAPDIRVNRDPFNSPDTGVGVSPSTAPPSAVVGMTVHQGDPMGYLVPNDGSPIVRAVISGAHPMALVEESGKVRIVRSGDLVSNQRITRIDSGGVLLQNGRILTLIESER